MLANRLSPGDTIGIFCPSHVMELPNPHYERIADVLTRFGFKVKFGENVSKDTYGYAASAEERAADLNALVADDEVKMVFFGGGDSAVEILPYIDYDNITRHPKLFSSYSDGTIILNAIYAQTGLVTYYGITPGVFADLRYYDWTQFQSHMVAGYNAKQFDSDSKWNILCGGSCEGLLIGGYLGHVAMMQGNRYFKYNEKEKYLLFLEDHKMFSDVGPVATFLAYIEQSSIMRNVTGLIFGDYGAEVPDTLLRCLERFGTKNNIPVAYTDDFGHGTKHAVFPIGMRGRLDTDGPSLLFVGE